MTHAGESLAAQVRPNFFVKLEERVFVHEPSAKDRGKFLGKPAITLFDAGPTGEMPVAVADPAINKIQSILVSIPNIEIERHAMIEIRDRKDRKLVTMIEVLSPSDKRYGPDREQYIVKRSALMYSTTSIVEIDLLKGSPRLPFLDLPECDYCVTLFRKPNASKAEAWPIGLRDELPVIPIPLNGDFPDASLDLKTFLNRVYDAAGYEDYLYASPSEPPLSQSDASWAASILGSSNLV